MILKIGLATDFHVYPSWPEHTLWLQETVNALTPWQPHLIAGLGDLVDNVANASFASVFSAVPAIFTVPGAERVLLPGNHEWYYGLYNTVYDAWPADVKAKLQPGKLYGSFDLQGALHVVVLDANYYTEEPARHAENSAYAVVNGYVPQEQRTWLAADLAATSLPTVVLMHQSLVIDKPNSAWTGSIVTNATSVRTLLEVSGKVIAVFCGHIHVDQHAEVNGIHYFSVNSIAANHDSLVFRDRGAHDEVTIDTTAKTIQVKVWYGLTGEEETEYILAQTTTVDYTFGADNQNPIYHPNGTPAGILKRNINGIWQ